MAKAAVAEPSTKSAKKESAAQRNLRLWNGLNDRQRLYLRTIYDADQAAEADRRADRAAGEWDDTPASIWRAIDAFHDSGSQKVITNLQRRWARFGEHNVGNGSTLAVLEAAALITPGTRRVAGFQGDMHTVTMTTLGRAVVRAGLGVTGGHSRPRLLLGERATEVLSLLYAAQSSRAGTLDWRSSTTIDNVLIDRAREASGHPFAETAGWRGYRITQAGAAYYREHFVQLQDAYPWQRLHLPAEVDLMDWPGAVDTQLKRLASGYTGLLDYRDRARADLDRARREAASVPEQPSPADRPTPRGTTSATTLFEELQAEREKLTARHGAALEQLHARQRASETRMRVGHAEALVAMLEQHVARIEGGIEPALATYVAAAAAVYTAVVDGGGVDAALAAVLAAGAHELTIPARLPPCSNAEIDARVQGLVKIWQKPPRRRMSTGKDPKPRPFTGLESSGLPAGLAATPHEAPYVLARELQRATADGYLHRLIAAGRRKQRIAAFQAVRAIPYATNAAATGRDLTALRRGNCVAKAELLATRLDELGVPTRRTRWLYQLPDQPQEIDLLPEGLDVHTACEAQIEGRWILVDATHDPALAAAGFTVADWDGHNPTAPAYPPIGPVWREGDAEPEPTLAERPDDEVGARYREAFNAWLEDVRRGE